MSRDKTFAQQLQAEKQHQLQEDEMAQKQRMIREAQENVKVREALIKMNKASVEAWTKGEGEDERSVAATSAAKPQASAAQVAQLNVKDAAAHKKEDSQREADVAAITAGVNDGVDQHALEKQIAAEHAQASAKEKILAGKQSQNSKDILAITGGLNDTQDRGQRSIEKQLAEEHKKDTVRSAKAMSQSRSKMQHEISEISEPALPEQRQHADILAHSAMVDKVVTHALATHAKGAQQNVREEDEEQKATDAWKKQQHEEKAEAKATATWKKSAAKAAATVTTKGAVKGKTGGAVKGKSNAKAAKTVATVKRGSQLVSKKLVTGGRHGAAAGVQPDDEGFVPNIVSYAAKWFR